MINKSGLQPGDKVTIHTCAEAGKYKGKIFTVASNTWLAGCRELVLLKEKPGGGFATMFLKKVGESK
jgi:hypothetical protein